MLAEHAGSTSGKGFTSGRKRWFTDDYFSLTVHYDNKDKPCMFELVWDRLVNPTCVRWQTDTGTRFYLIDMGEDSPLANRTPVLQKSCAPDLTDLFARFQSASASLDPVIRNLVETQLSPGN